MPTSALEARGEIVAAVLTELLGALSLVGRAHQRVVGVDAARDAGAEQLRQGVVGQILSATCPSCAERQRKRSRRL